MKKICNIYMFLNQIWFCECNWYLLKVKSSCCVGGIFNLKCVLFESLIPNLSLNYLFE